MSAQAVAHGFDKYRTLLLGSNSARFHRGSVDSQNIVAIHSYSFNAIARATGGDPISGKLFSAGSGNSIAIIAHHKHHRAVKHCSHI